MDAVSIAIAIVVLWAIWKANRSINQLANIATAKIDVLEVTSAYEDARQLQKVGTKITKLGKIVTAQEMMSKLTKVEADD